MSSQNNTGRQYQKDDAITVVATVALSANRFVSYNGGYPVIVTGGGAGDVQGVAEYAADVGDAVSVITEYSALVEAAEAIANFAWVKPDANGKAVAGTAADHCGRALGAATQAGDLIEVQILPHVHA